MSEANSQTAVAVVTNDSVEESKNDPTEFMETTKSNVIPPPVTSDMDQEIFYLKNMNQNLLSNRDALLKEKQDLSDAMEMLNQTLEGEAIEMKISPRLLLITVSVDDNCQLPFPE